MNGRARLFAFSAVIIAAAVAGCGGGHSAAPASSTTWTHSTGVPAPPPVPRDPNVYGADGSCDGDATPKKDGICRVSGGGMFDTGIMAGWIATPGPRPGSSHCNWVRLSGPSMTIENTIQAGRWKSGQEDPVTARVEPSDFAFASFGCAPWRHVS